MNAPRFELPEGDRLRVRSLVATIDRELSCLSLEGTPDDHGEAKRGLGASWAQLVEMLALGPAPEVRPCSTCKRVCMRAATRCGHCWAKLSPVPAVAAGVAR